VTNCSSHPSRVPNIHTVQVTFTKLHLVATSCCFFTPLQHSRNVYTELTGPSQFSQHFIPNMSSTPIRGSPSPISFRTPMRRSNSSISRRTSSHTFAARLQKRAIELQRQGLRIFLGLTPFQRIALVIFGSLSFLATILSLVYHDDIFSWLGGFAKSWRNITGGWLILWFMTFVVAFPPLIGYSTCVMLGGFVYGFPNGCVTPVPFFPYI
jgi:hypothetical protein